jgi:hypothetical protein
MEERADKTSTILYVPMVKSKETPIQKEDEQHQMLQGGCL